MDQQPPSSHFSQAYPSHHFQPMPPIISAVPIVHLVPNNIELITTTLPPISVAITNNALNSQPMPTSPTGPPPPFPPPLSSTASTVITPTSVTPSIQTPTVTTQRSIPNNNNDLNDAQNISKILQSLHNGSGSSSIGSTVANHNNDKSKHDDEVLTVQVNNKEEKLNNEKQQHHRAKRKSQNPSTPKPAAAVQQKKSTSHVHTNGLVSEKKSNNRLSNGVEETSLDDEVAEKTKEENQETRSLVFREIRKLGRDYSGLYEQLAKIKGSSEVRFSFVQMCIDEATRFRRKHMADCIQEWWLSKCDENNEVEQKTGTKKK